MNSDGKPHNYSEIQENYENCITWLEYLQLIKAIPKTWWYLAQKDTKYGNDCKLKLKDVKGIQKCSSKIYNFIIDTKAKDDLVLIYSKYCELDEYDIQSFSNLFKNLYKLTKETKLHDFQYRMLIGKIFTNDILARWHIVTQNTCDFCESVQTVRHLFWECEKVKPIMIYIGSKFKDVTVNYMMNFNCRIHRTITHLANFLILLAKHYVFRCKCQKTNSSVMGFIKIAKHKYDIEHHNAQKENTIKNFTRKWEVINMEDYD